MRVNSFVASLAWRSDAWQANYYPNDLPKDWYLDYYQNDFRCLFLSEAELEELHSLSMLGDLDDESMCFLSVERGSLSAETVDLLDRYSIRLSGVCYSELSATPESGSDALQLPSNWVAWEDATGYWQTVEGIDVYVNILSSEQMLQPRIMGTKVAECMQTSDGRQAVFLFTDSTIDADALLNMQHVLQLF